MVVACDGGVWWCMVVETCIFDGGGSDVLVVTLVVPSSEYCWS